MKIIDYENIENMIKLKYQKINKKCSQYPKVRVNSLKTSTIYACFWCFKKMRRECMKYEKHKIFNYKNIDKIEKIEVVRLWFTSSR